MTCAACGAANLVGACFCAACALPLGAPGPAAPAAPPGPGPARLVRLRDGAPTGEAIALPATDWAGTLLVGRTDLAGGVVVDVDLTRHAGLAEGVSRRQAQLHYVTRPGGGANAVRVADWASANGTWLNKARLAAGASEELATGDEVRFAGLVYRFEA